MACRSVSAVSRAASGIMSRTCSAGRSRIQRVALRDGSREPTRDVGVALGASSSCAMRPKDGNISEPNTCRAPSDVRISTRKGCRGWRFSNVDNRASQARWRRPPSVLERRHGGGRHADRDGADVVWRETVRDEEEVEDLMTRGAWSRDADGAAFQVADSSHRAAQRRRHSERCSGPRVEEQEPAHVTAFDRQLHRIRDRRDGHVDAAAEQRLDRFGASRDLGRRHDRRPLCLS